MNREALIEQLLRDTTANFQTRHDAELALSLVLEGITRGLKKNKKISLSGFGTFRVVRRKARNGIDPTTGDKLRIKAQSTIKFKVGTPLQKRL